MNTPRDACWRELRKQLELLQPGQLLTAAQVAERFRITTGKSVELVVKTLGVPTFDHALQQIETIECKVDGPQLSYFKKQQSAATGNGGEIGGVTTSSSQSQLPPATSHHRAERGQQAGSALNAAASINNSGGSKWNAFGSAGFGVRPTQLPKKPVVASNGGVESGVGGGSSRQAAAASTPAPLQIQLPRQECIWNDREESDDESLVVGNQRSRAPPSPVGNGNSASGGNSSTNGLQQGNFGNDQWEYGSNGIEQPKSTSRARFTERGSGQYTDCEGEGDDESDYGGNIRGRQQPRQASNPAAAPPLRRSPMITNGTNSSTSPFKFLPEAQRTRPSSVLPQRETLGGSSAFRSIAVNQQRPQGSGMRPLQPSVTTMAPPQVAASVVRTAQGNMPALMGAMRPTAQEPRPTKFSTTAEVVAQQQQQQQSALPPASNGLAQSNTAVRRLTDNRSFNSGRIDYEQDGSVQSNASSVSTRTITSNQYSQNSTSTSTGQIINYGQEDDGQSEASTVRQDEIFQSAVSQPRLLTPLPASLVRHDSGVVNGGWNNGGSGSEMSGSPHRSIPSGQLSSALNGVSVGGNRQSNSREQKAPNEAELSRLAEQIAGMAKYAWPNHIRLDDALAAIEVFLPQFVDPERVIPGFRYDELLTRKCASLRIHQLPDTYALQWVEKPGTMLLANPPSCHNDFANASIQCLRYIPDIFRYLRTHSSPSGDAVLDEVARIVSSSVYAGHSVSHLRSLPELGGGRFAHGQCDAAEFLVDELLYSHAPPEWRKLFTYVYRDKIECRSCHDKIYDHTQEARSVDITVIDGEQKLSDRLELLDMRKNVDGYRCGKCKMQSGKKRREYSFASTKYLLMNFKPSDDSMRLFDSQLMPQIRGHREDRQEIFGYKWRAIATIVHEGPTLNSGHHYAMGRWEGESEWQVLDDDKEPRRHARLDTHLQGHYIIIYEKLR